MRHFALVCWGISSACWVLASPEKFLALALAGAACCFGMEVAKAFGRKVEP